MKNEKDSKMLKKEFEIHCDRFSAILHIKFCLYITVECMAAVSYSLLITSSPTSIYYCYYNFCMALEHCFILLKWFFWLFDFHIAMVILLCCFWIWQNLTTIKCTYSNGKHNCFRAHQDFKPIQMSMYEQPYIHNWEYVCIHIHDDDIKRQDGFFLWKLFFFWWFAILVLNALT